MEHPAEPGFAPYPSIFNTETFQRWLAAHSSHVVTFPQCQWGSPARKRTSLARNLPHLEDLSVPCMHVAHEGWLCGLDEKGRFRTRTAQAYPVKLCRKMAQVSRRPACRRACSKKRAVGWTEVCNKPRPTLPKTTITPRRLLPRAPWVRFEFDSSLGYPGEGPGAAAPSQGRLRHHAAAMKAHRTHARERRRGHGA